MINKIAVYYMLFVFIIIFISRFFITDASVSNYNKHMSDIGNAIYEDTISDILDEGLKNVENIVDSIVGDKLDSRPEINSSLAKSILQFGIYMPQDLVTDIDIKMESFLLIKSLVMEQSILLDSGAVAYFRYAFKEKVDGIDPEILCSSNCYEIEHFNRTDPNKINGLILEKELFLENGAIFYFAYKF